VEWRSYRVCKTHGPSAFWAQKLSDVLFSGRKTCKNKIYVNIIIEMHLLNSDISKIKAVNAFDYYALSFIFNDGFTAYML